MKAGGGRRGEEDRTRCASCSSSPTCSVGSTPVVSPRGGLVSPASASSKCPSHSAAAAEAAPSRGQSRASGGRPSFAPPPPVRPSTVLPPPWARPLPGCSLKPPSPADSHPSPTLAPPSRSVPLSYKLLDGEAARPALVFLHGLFGCKTNFNFVAKALAQQTGRKVRFRERRVPRGRRGHFSALAAGPWLRSGRCLIRNEMRG